MDKLRAQEILELKQGFNEDELTKQYRNMVKKYHPDSGNTADEDKFMEVYEAYKFLLHIKDGDSADGNAETPTPCPRCDGTGIRREKIKTPHGYMARKVPCKYCKGTGMK